MQFGVLRMSLTFVNKFVFDYICVPEYTYKLWHTGQICKIQRNTRHHLEPLRSSVILCASLLLLLNRNRFGNLIRRCKKALITRRQQWMAAQATSHCSTASTKICSLPTATQDAIGNTKKRGAIVNAQNNKNVQFILRGNWLFYLKCQNQGNVTRWFDFGEFDSPVFCL